MLEIERHIEILLLNNDCVIIPGFGGFMAHHVEARYDEGDDIFLPPSRTVGFNPQLKLNDSLLAQSYIEAYDISYPEALNRIQQEVAELRLILDNQGEYEFSDIGTLSLDEDGHFQFTPCEAGILTPYLYGLSSFQMKVLSYQKPQAKGATIVPSKVSVDNADIQQLTEDTYAAEEEEEEKTVSIKVSLLRNIAAACIVFMAFLLIPAPLNNDKILSNTTPDTSLLLKIMPSDMTAGSMNSQSPNFQRQAKKAVAKVVDSISTVKKTAEVKAANTPYYSLVLASKVSRHNAEAYVARLQASGYKDASIVEKSQNRKVVYGKYATAEEARLALNKLNDNSEFADCWISKIN
uniref:SPOR domain-containing protein n=1 Tax=Prevotella sp. GTC17262 TaxID=3236797 RepID=A0AB33JFP8_9BACT